MCWTEQQCIGNEIEGGEEGFSALIWGACYGRRGSGRVSSPFREAEGGLSEQHFRKEEDEAEMEAGAPDSD